MGCPGPDGKLLDRSAELVEDQAVCAEGHDSVPSSGYCPIYYHLHSQFITCTDQCKPQKWVLDCLSTNQFDSFHGASASSM
jgi:hypothetical protein